MLALAALASAPHSDAGQLLPAVDIVQAVQRRVAEQLSAKGRRVIVNVAGRVSDQPLPAGRAEIAIDPIQGALPRLRAAVPVRLLLDGRLIRSMTVWVEMHDERTVMTYAASYPAHRGGNTVAVTEARVNLACCDGVPVERIVDVRDLRTRRAVRVGEPVMKDDFGPLPDVSAQRAVSVEVTRGSIRLVAKGVALQDGAIGERIALRVEPGQGPVQGRVVAKDKVKIDD